MSELPADEFHIGCDALLWLNRALTYNQLFLTYFAQEYEKCTKLSELPEDISKLFTTAYDLTLKKHHNWFVQKIFNVCLMAAPSRSQLLVLLGLTDLSDEEIQSILVNSITDYLKSLKANTESISILLFQNGFQP